MKHEIKKLMKIADEVMTYCMYNFEADRADLSVEKNGSAYEMSFRFRNARVSEKELASMRKKLAVKRNHELEDYYWQLAGEIENSNELSLVAMMSDTSTVEYRGGTLLIAITRQA